MAAGAIQTPALLRRSGLGNKNIGRYLRLHPAAAVFGLFDEEVRPWEGGLQTRICRQHADLDGNGYGVIYETGEFTAAEILVVVVFAAFEDDHIETCRGEHSGGGPTTGTGADDHDITGEARRFGDALRCERGLRRIRQGSGDRVVAQVFPQRIASGRPRGDVVCQQRRLLEGLEHRPHGAEPGRAEPQQRLLPVLLRQFRIPPRTPSGEQPGDRTVPQIQQHRQLLGFGFPRVARQKCEHRVHSAQFGCRGQPRPVPRQERIADHLQRGALFVGRLHGFPFATADFYHGVRIFAHL
ncbi:GMC family oxidoreductase N-terminal domain-containing protein [Nocardia speluncae]|uniref:GMC family oxidoreductase N-terminal domain-containing protein n=1 Tax=Nocardia speluncae TaxID=419477 RepID=UPI00353144CD